MIFTEEFMDQLLSNVLFSITHGTIEEDCRNAFPKTSFINYYQNTKQNLIKTFNTDTYLSNVNDYIRADKNSCEYRELQMIVLLQDIFEYFPNFEYADEDNKANISEMIASFYAQHIQY